MNQSSFSNVRSIVLRELNDILSVAQELLRAVRDSLGRRSLNADGRRMDGPPMIDPVRFKKILVALLKVLVIIELVGSFSQGVGHGAGSALTSLWQASYM